MITYVLPFFLALGSCCAYLTTVNKSKKSKRFGKTFFRLQVTWKSHFCSVSLLGRARGALTLPTIQLASIPSAFLHTFPNMVSSNEYRNFPPSLQLLDLTSLLKTSSKGRVAAAHCEKSPSKESQERWLRC